MARRTMNADGSDSEVEDEGESGPSARRLPEAEDARLEYVVRACTHGVAARLPRALRVSKQVGDTCLVHAIVNATQRHDALRDMLRAVRRIGAEEGRDHRDKAVGMAAAAEVLGCRSRQGFDVYRDAAGIAHVYTHSAVDHFVALRRVDGVLYLLDSLPGRAYMVHDEAQLARRSSLVRLLL